jgi:hypothetical protein
VSKGLGIFKQLVSRSRRGPPTTSAGKPVLGSREMRYKPPHLSNLDKLVVVVMAIEEWLFPEDLHEDPRNDQVSVQ